MTVPHGIDPVQAMRLLQQNLPGENFQLNRLYHLYQPAMKENAERHAASPATLGGKKCSWRSLLCADGDPMEGSD